MTMKKIILLILLLFPMVTFAESSECYIVMDANSNRVLDGKNIKKEKLIASTTKIMTAIIIIENTNLDEVVTVGDEINSAFGSSIYLHVNEKIKIIDLLYGLLLRSGNDAANVLATHYAGSMEDFATIMNQYAKKIGMNQTHFINSSGLENNAGIGNTSTVYDMALLMSYAINNPIFLDISSTKKYQCQTSERNHEWVNKNKLLFKYDKLIAGKTGYTQKAKRTLVTAAMDKNRRLVIVTFNDGNDFKDHLDLYQSNFKKYQNVDICDYVNIKDPLNIFSKYDFIYKKDCNVLLSNSEIKKLKVETILNKKHNSSNIGVINFKIDNSIIHQESLEISKKKK